MAWLEQKNSGNFHVVFRIGGEKLRRSLRTRDRREARSRLARLEENIRLVEAGRLTVPEGSDVITLLLSDGKLNQQLRIPRRLLLGQLYERYVENLPADSIEAGSLATAKTHMNHVTTILGRQLDLRNLTLEHLQLYVNQRSTESGRFGKRVSSATIKKELATFRSLWNWALASDYVAKPLVLRTLRYPKLDEKPPYRTREEIDNEIALTKPSHLEQQELWHGLYLRTEEIVELLSLIKQNARHGYLYPMVAFAAYTGARRSELCRSQIRDLCLHQNKMLIREKKRNRAKRTYRQVPIISPLSPILSEWLENRVEGLATFAREWQTTRRHTTPEVEGGVLPAEAHKHLQQALRGTEWEIVPGWHTFRHSFISNCASHGVDQRMIDDWVGHQTDEQRKRYRHLFPDVQRKELEKVF